MSAINPTGSRASFILVAPLPPPIDGQSLAFELLVRGLVSGGTDVCVVNISRPAEQVGPSHARRALEYLRILAGFAYALARHPEASVYLTIAQSRAGFLRDAAFVGLARLARRPVAIHLHGGNYGGFFDDQPPLLQRAIRRVLRSTQVIIVLADRLRAMFDFAPELASRIVAVPNGLPGVAPVRNVKRAPEVGAPWRLLFLSNLIESKGFLETIEATSLLAKRGIPVELNLCGEFRANPSDDRRVTSAAQAQELTESRIRELDLEGRARLRGVVRGADKLRMLEEAHVFVLPTQYDAEGQPLSIIEAMAFGCAVVSTDYRGIPDLVEDGVTGFLSPSSDATEIADRIERIASKPAEFERMSLAACMRFEAKFTAEAHLAAMREALGIRG